MSQFLDGANVLWVGGFGEDGDEVPSVSSSDHEAIEIPDTQEYPLPR